MQGPGNAVVGLGRSGGTLGSRCHPLEQPTPFLPPPKDALPSFRASWNTSLSLGRPLGLTSLSPPLANLLKNPERPLGGPLCLLEKPLGGPLWLTS